MVSELLNTFIGKPLKSIERDESGNELIIKFADGTGHKLGVEGDCCSSSWIEHLEMPADISGAVIQSVDEPELAPWDNHKCEPIDGKEYMNKCEHDSLAVYHTRFRTDKGDIVLEYRNDSNGYYGGYLTDGGAI